MSSSLCRTFFHEQQARKLQGVTTSRCSEEILFFPDRSVSEAEKVRRKSASHHKFPYNEVSPETLHLQSYVSYKILMRTCLWKNRLQRMHENHKVSFFGGHVTSPVPHFCHFYKTLERHLRTLAGKHLFRHFQWTNVLCARPSVTVSLKLNLFYFCCISAEPSDKLSRKLFPTRTELFESRKGFNWLFSVAMHVLLAVRIFEP